jgi:hypothetical protein
MSSSWAPARALSVVASRSGYSGSFERGAAPSVHTCTPVRSHPYWTRFWAAWVGTLVVSGGVVDTIAYVQGGYPATLTGHIRRWTGQEPHTRFHRLGQVAVTAFLTWAAVHLGFGVLGPNRGRDLAPGA